MGCCQAGAWECSLDNDSMRGARLVHKLAGVGLGDPNQAQLRAEEQRLVHGRAGAVDVKLLDVGGDAAEGLVHLGVPVYCYAAPHQPACARAMRQPMASRATQDLHSLEVFLANASMPSTLSGKCQFAEGAGALTCRGGRSLPIFAQR